MSNERELPPPESVHLLERVAEAKERLRVEPSKLRESPLSQLAASSGEGITAEAGLPYVVWLDNQSWANLDVIVYWGQYNISGVQQTGGTVYSGQTAPFQLGGANGCGAVYAYVLQILYQGNLVGNTGVVQPDASDGYPCSDAWGVA